MAALSHLLTLLPPPEPAACAIADLLTLIPNTNDPGVTTRVEGVCLHCCHATPLVCGTNLACVLYPGWLGGWHSVDRIMQDLGAWVCASVFDACSGCAAPDALCFIHFSHT